MKNRLLYILVIFFNIALAIRLVNPHELYGPDLKKYQINHYSKAETEHIIGYGIDETRAELLYKLVGHIFVLDNLKDKVIIYKANIINNSNSAIRKFDNGTEIVGIYYPNKLGKDTIIYNGNFDVLIHELCHFYYNRMSNNYRTEVIAILGTDYIIKSVLGITQDDSKI